MSQAVMEEAPARPSHAELGSPQALPDVAARWLPPLVLLAAVGLGIGMYAWFWEHSLDLWWRMAHDRHTHYVNGLDLALDVRDMDVVRLVRDFEHQRIKGPLHPVLVALLELPAGPDHRLAVLPSLAGWILTIWLAFMIPRRMLPGGGSAAGLLAAFFVAISPAHRAFATDVMYESLGAGLSLAAIYLYLCVIQDGSKNAAAGLVITLTALFLHKYNYWLLVCLGLVGGEFFRQPRVWVQWGLGLCQRDHLPSWAVAELKQPLNYIVLLLSAAAVTIAITGGWTIAVGKFHVSLQEPHNLIHAAYIAFFIRLALWWRKSGQAWSLTWPDTLRRILVWHGGAVALWFLLPKRLSYFIWYLTVNDDQKREHVGFLHGIPSYLQALREDYLPMPGGVYLFFGMLLLGLFAWPRLKTGSAAVFAFLLVAALLVCQHPMLKHRFVHSWIAVGWIIGAVGLIAVVERLTGWLSEQLRPWAAGLAAAALIGVGCPWLLEPGHAQEAGLRAGEPSILRITDTYLPALADSRNPTIVSNVSARFQWCWTYIERYHRHDVAGEVKNFKAFDGDPAPARKWLETTDADALVLVDVAPGSRFDNRTDEYVDLSAFHQALAEQTRWVQTRRWDLPEGVAITLWQPSNK